MTREFTAEEIAHSKALASEYDQVLGRLIALTRDVLTLAPGSTSFTEKHGRVLMDQAREVGRAMAVRDEKWRRRHLVGRIQLVLQWASGARQPMKDRLKQAARDWCAANPDHVRRNGTTPSIIGGVREPTDCAVAGYFAIACELMARGLLPIDLEAWDYAIERQLGMIEPGVNDEYALFELAALKNQLADRSSTSESEAVKPAGGAGE